MIESEFLSVEEIAKILRIRPNTIQSSRWKKSSGCPLIRLGKRLLSPVADFRRWVKERGMAVAGGEVGEAN